MIDSIKYSGHVEQVEECDFTTVDSRQENCTKFVQLILRKIIKIVSTRCQILRLKCTQFDFGWGTAPDPAEKAGEGEGREGECYGLVCVAA